jgi:hypothetical protein
MFNNTANIQRLTAEILVHLASFLEVATILQLSLTCKAFSHIIKDELVFRRLTESDYHITDKTTEQTWLELYKDLHNDKETMPSTKKEPMDEVPAIDSNTTVKSEAPTDQTRPIEETTATNTLKNEGECPHLIELPETINEVKRIIYKSGHSSVCDICSTEQGTFLNMGIDNHNEGKNR